MKKQYGMTLVELVVVITVIGILAAAAMPRLSNMSSNARVTQVQATEKALEAAVNMFVGEAELHGENGQVTVNEQLFSYDRNKHPILNEQPEVLLNAILDLNGMNLEINQNKLWLFDDSLSDGEESDAAVCGVYYTLTETKVDKIDSVITGC